MFYQGESVSTDRVIYTPSTFAKASLLHVQEIGTLQAVRPHISSRENLKSCLFLMVNSGSGVLVSDGKRYLLSGGMCAFVDCAHSYSHETDTDLWNLSWIHFYGPTASSIYQKYVERGGAVAFSPESIQPYKDVFADLYDVVNSPSYTRDMEINSLISDLLTLLMKDSWQREPQRPSREKKDTLEIKEYLDSHYGEKITLDDLSREFCINKYYMSRLFKRQFGSSVMDYLRHVRITEAKRLLRFEDKTIRQIALEVGLSDEFYLSRVFKQVEGICIRDYRRNWK